MSAGKDPFKEEEFDEFEGVGKAEAEAEAEAEADRQRILDMQRALQHDYVRRTLFHLVAVCRPLESPWAPGAEMGKNVGRMEVGQHILGLIAAADPRGFGQIMADEFAKKLKESQA